MVQWGDVDGYDHSSLYDDKRYSEFKLPGSIYTDAWSINNLGQVVFSWYDKDWNGHGAVLKSGKHFVFDDPKGPAPGPTA
jgi:hypothetical protein